MAMVDHGIAAAILTTPQFFLSQKAIEAATCWTADQFIGRNGHYIKLPDALSDGDLRGVASALLPGGNSNSIKALVLYAKSSRKYLAGIAAIVNRARFICQKDGRQKVEFRDIKRALQESVIPSDTALTGAIGIAANPARKRAARVFTNTLQPDFQPQATPMQNRRAIQPAAAGARRAGLGSPGAESEDNFAETVSASLTSKT
jgi:hypothetical protein